jgi:glycosyltransferase involved in cell wall biosynthesis
LGEKGKTYEITAASRPRSQGNTKRGAVNLDSKKTILYLGGPVDSISRAKIIQLVSVCSVLGERGHKVLLFLSTIPGFTEDIYEYFRVPKTFQTIFLPTKHRNSHYEGVYRQSQRNVWGISRISARSQITFHLRCIFSVLKYKKKKDEEVIIITRDHYCAFLGLLFRRFHHYPLFFEPHGLAYTHIYDKNFVFSGKKHLISKVAYFLGIKVERYILTRSNAIFSVTRRQLIIAKAECDGKMSPGLVVPSGVFLEEFKAIRQSKRLNKKILRLLYVGSITLWKGVEILLMGVANLKKIGLPVHLTIVGGSEGEPDFWRVQRLISKLKIQDFVSFEGYTPHKEVSRFMTSCDLAVLPYPPNANNNYALSPLRMVEFLAAKMPMIVFDNPCIHEIVRNNETAIIVDPNMEALVRAIVAIREDRSIMNKIASQGYKIAKYYDWNVRVRLIENFLQRLEKGALKEGEIVGREELLSEADLEKFTQRKGIIGHDELPTTLEIAAKTPS